MEQYTISVAPSRTSPEWPNKATSWEKLTERLAKCKHTRESAAEYRAMSKTAQGKVKDIGGFVGGTVRDGGRRKADAITARSLVTLDIDFGTAATVETVREMLDGTAWCLYSTHSHTPSKPRYRIVVPLSREVSPDEYVPIARRLADDIGIDLFDDSTYEPSRLMYWPSAPADMDFVYETGQGEPADADRILDSYTDWRNPLEWPVSKRVTKAITRKAGARQEDPVEKGGVIGAFCRSYSITEAIAAFLPEVYVPTGHPDRWTYAKGTTEGGAIVYEDKWLYSHHGTDPCCEKLVNAFDLVRLHLYGAEDQDADINTPANRLPSFLHMEKTAREDRKVHGVLVRDMIKDFDGVDVTGEEDESWKDDLQTDDKRKKFLPLPTNFGLILRNDRGVKGAVAYDLFSGRAVLKRDLPWRPMALDPQWNNNDYNGLIEYVDQYYRGLTGKTALMDEADHVFAQNNFHPVRDYLNGLQWDGTERLDTMLTDYLGAEPSELTRAMTRKHFAAAVARVMTPGIKYDYVLTLIGPEGSGKSTLVRLMAKDTWFTDSLNSIEGKEAMEQLRGKWLVEMGELTNYKKSTSEAYKAFLSKQDDSFRPAYGRKTETYPRQCVFFATTNEKAFLKGDTGNRRFWVVECGAVDPVKDVWDDLPGEVDQLWAEAVVRWKAGERLFLDREMTKAARERQEAHNEVTADDRIGLIDAYVHKAIPQTWECMTAKQRADWFKTAAEMEGEPRMRRRTVCAVEVLVECFGQQLDEKTRYRTREINQILKGMDCLEEGDRERDNVYGLQRRYRIIYDDEIQ